MKAYFIVTIGRQLNGELVTVRFEKAFLELARAEMFVNGLAKQVLEKVMTPQGQVDFVCERGVHEIDIEE
jgi:hypothetical protein